MSRVCKRGGKEAVGDRARGGGHVRGKRAGALRGRDGEEKGKMEEEEEKENAEEGVEASEEGETRWKGTWEVKEHEKLEVGEQRVEAEEEEYGKREEG